MTIKSTKKLIEVALPLDAINAEASLRKRKAPAGYPTGLHKWWAQRPPAAARAVLFAQMVNDPGGERGYYAGKTKAQADAEREKLFQIIRDLVQWENTNNEDVLERARSEIRKSWRETCELNKGKPGFDPDKLPAFHDPFAGSGAIPLEAQRLGLESYASDLNPVAVLINKAMIEIPPKFAARRPVGPIPKGERQQKLHEDWSGARGLAEDVRRYGHWMREQAEQRIGHLYPKVKVTAEMAKDRPDLKPYIGDELTVIAWLWARTVKSPNPACSQVDVPLASSFILSSKAGKEAWVEPIVEGDRYRFAVRVGKPPAEAKDGTKLARGANFRCVMSTAPIEPNHIYGEANAGRMGARLMAIVAEGTRGRVYLEPTADAEAVAAQAKPTWKPEVAMPENPRWFSPPLYGLKTYGDLFTPRQLVALTTFSDLVTEAREKIIADAKAAGLPDPGSSPGQAGQSLDTGGNGATAYGDAVAVYLAFAASRCADYGCSIATWRPKDNAMRSGMAKQAIPMTWDYAEGNPFAKSSAGILECCEVVARVLVVSLAPSAGCSGYVLQSNAADPDVASANNVFISTDPPYYDNIGYADLSDFFYVLLRRTLGSVLGPLFRTLAVPKAEELVATPYRHGGKENAEKFFLSGMKDALRATAARSHLAAPITIYYAFKQAETKDAATASTGWETFLEAVIGSSLSITGTWPVQTEGDNRQVGVGNNALASSIVLVCRKRETSAESISRRDFQRQLREQMPEALETMIGGTSGQSPIAPVDLAQAAIGPGMAIFSKYAAVLNQDGTPMSVHDALILINREITEYLTPDAGSFDADTLFCNGWFEQYGWSAGPFGEADVLARGKGTSVGGVTDAGVIESGGGKVRLYRWAEYPDGWDAKTDTRTPIWEATHHLIRAVNRVGEVEAGALLAAMPDKAEPIRQLAYHLYTLCERKKWADDARAYNELITAWHAIVAASHEAVHSNTQLGMDV